MSACAEATAFAASLRARGLGLHGVLGIDAYDALAAEPFRSAQRLPAARSAIVVGSLGGALWKAFEGQRPQPGADPLDAFVERAVADALAALGSRAAAVFAHRPLGGRFLDVVALARACGLGFESRLGLLLHPEAGPWMSLRAVVLTERVLPPAEPLSGPSPCDGCPAPCSAACPVAAPRADGFDVPACALQRRDHDACRLRCAARRACPVGASFAYPDAAEAHHMRASLASVVSRARPAGPGGQKLGPG